MEGGLFQWDDGNLPKLKRHRVTVEEVMEAMFNEPLFIYPQHGGQEQQALYYGQSRTGRLLAIVVTERGDQLRVITA